VRPGPSARRPLPSGAGPRLLRLAPPAAAVSSPRLTGRQFPRSVPRGSRAVSAPGQFPVAHEPSVPRVRSPRLTGLQLPSQTPWRTGRQFPESAPSEQALVGTFGQRADGTPVWPPSGESSCVSSRAGSSRAGMACGFPCRCEVRMIREYDTTALPASGPALPSGPPGPGRGPAPPQYDTTALPASGPALLPGPPRPGQGPTPPQGVPPRPIPTQARALRHWGLHGTGPRVGLGREAVGGATLSLLTIARLPPGHDPGAVDGGAPAARQRGPRPCDIMVLGVNRSGYGGASGADQKQAIPSRVGPALRADRYEGEGEPYDSARSLRGTCKLAVSNRTQGDTLGPGCDPGAGRVMSPPPSNGHGGAASAALGSRPRRGGRGTCHATGAPVAAITVPAARGE